MLAEKLKVKRSYISKLENVRVSTLRKVVEEGLGDCIFKQNYNCSQKSHPQSRQALVTRFGIQTNLHNVDLALILEWAYRFIFFFLIVHITTPSSF